MMTVGPEDGEVTGTVAGQKVYHSSLSTEEYIGILKENNLRVLEFKINDKDCQGFTVFIAQKDEA